MKTSRPSYRSLAIALASSIVALAPAIQAQVSATSDPVGFITLNIAGTNGESSSALSFKGLGLTRPVEYQGSAETVGPATLVDNDATWADNEFNPMGATVDTATHYVEIVRPAGATEPVPGEGTTYDIIGTNAATKTITLAQNLAPGVANGANFKIRKHWTIGSVFGPNNEAGLKAGDVTTADQVLIYNGTGYDTYFYLESIFGNGWVSAADSSDATNQKILPDDGLIIKRRDASDLNVVLVGAVKKGQTSIPVFPGNNIISNVYAAPLTLGSSGLFTGNPATGVAGGDSTTADQVLLYNGTGYDIYFYLQSIFGNNWVKAADNSDATNTPIPVGESIVIKRRGAAGFDWKVPQHPASL